MVGHSLYGHDISTWFNSIGETIWPDIYLRYPQTQIMANKFPGYMRGRHDKYSVYQQILNIIGKQSDDLKRALVRHRMNKFAPTYLHDTLDVIYTVNKYQGIFSNVQVFNGSTWVNIPKSDYTTYEEWYYDSIPNCFINIGDKTIYPYTTNIIPLDKTLLPDVDFDQITSPVRLFVALTADQNVSFIKKIKNEENRPTEIIIYGKDEYDRDIEERFEFIYATQKLSQHILKEIYRIECVYWDENITLRLSSSPDPTIGIEDGYINYIDTERNLKPLFWQLENDKVNLRAFAANSVSEKEAGVNDINTIKTYTLLDVNSDTPISNIVSIYPSRFNNILYALSADNNLYLYNKYDQFSSLVKKASELQTPDPLIDLDVEEDTDKLIISGIFNRDRLNAKVSKYRFSIIHPDGSREYYNDVWSGANDYVDYPFSNYGFASPIIEYSFNYSEDLIVVLDILGDNGITYTDTYIVDNRYKPAISKIPTGIDITTVHKLSEIDNNILTIVEHPHFGNMLGSVTKFKLINFSYLEAAERNLLILPVDKPVRFQITVMPEAYSGQYNPVPFNVTTELDQMGDLLSVKRQLGEMSIVYVKKVREASYIKPDSTFKGMLHAISRDLNLSITDFITISVNTQLPIKIEHPYISVDNDQLNLFKYTADEVGVADLTGTVEDVVSWLTDIGVTIDEVDNTLYSKPARCLVPFSNIKRFYKQTFTGSNYISIELPENAELLNDSVSIEGFNTVAIFPNQLDTLVEPAFFVNGNTIKTNRTLTHDNKVSYSIIYKKVTLKISDACLYSIDSIDTNMIDGGLKTIVGYLEDKFPNKWIS